MHTDAQEARFERALQERIVLAEASFQRQRAELQDDAEREIASMEQVCQWQVTLLLIAVLYVAFFFNSISLTVHTAVYTISHLQ
jgi:hypothetical protein